MRLTLKNGTVYILREPPRISGRLVIFTTMDGHAFSMDQNEIEAVGVVPRVSPTPRRYNVEDSHALGAITRQEREHQGKKAEVAPAAVAARCRGEIRTVAICPRCLCERLAVGREDDRAMALDLDAERRRRGSDLRRDRGGDERREGENEREPGAGLSTHGLHARERYQSPGATGGPALQA